MESKNKTDTAHLEWDKKWKTEKGRDDWSVPEESVIEAISLLCKRGSRTVLDLGCGVGRHSLLLAEKGFEVYAFDGSETGISYLSLEREKKGLNVSNGEWEKIPRL